MKQIIAMLLLVLFLAPAANAALNPDRPFESDGEYIQSFDALSNVISGAATMQTSEARNGSVFLGSDAFSVTGLTRLYWDDGQCQPACAAEGENLRLLVHNGSSIAMRAPDYYGLQFDAEHAIAFFADAAALFGGQAENLGFGPSLVAFPVGGSADLEFGYLPETPVAGSSFNDFVDESVLVLALSAATTLSLYGDDGTLLATRIGEGEYVGFQGTPVVESIRAQVMAVPTPDGSRTEFKPATEAAAEAGFAPQHLEDIVSTLGASQGGADLQTIQGLQDVTAGLSQVLNGAFLGIDAVNGTGGAAELLQSATVIRFTSMNADRDGSALALAGSAPLQIQNGEVAGASPLIGIFPWWSLLLWAVALGAFVLRVMMKPEKKNETWDKLSWIGALGGVAASLLVFLLWDLETKALWGTSIMSSGASGANLGVIALIQIVPLMLAGIAIGLPARIIIKSGTRFAGQGNMMRIGAILAPFLVLLLGAQLMLDYLGLLIDAIARYF